MEDNVDHFVRGPLNQTPGPEDMKRRKEEALIKAKQRNREADQQESEAQNNIEQNKEPIRDEDEVPLLDEPQHPAESQNNAERTNSVKFLPGSPTENNESKLK